MARVQKWADVRRARVKRFLRSQFHARLDSLVPGDRELLIAPIPPRVVEWVREWINNAPLEELEQWHICASCQDAGVRFERFSRERDDSVTVLEKSIVFHIFDREDRESRDRKGVWLEVAIDPPHEVIEHLPSREEAQQ